MPFPSPKRERKSESEVAQSCLTLSDPIDCSPPGPSIHGIFQSRVLEWGPLPSPDKRYESYENAESFSHFVVVVQIYSVKVS